jgi:hypothetical protein
VLLVLAVSASLGRADDFAPPTLPPPALRAAYDVVVAGAGTGGIGAAIQAARLGATVLLLEETDWVGGQMLAAAVTAIDEGGAGNLVRSRGLYRELVQRVEAYYRPRGLDPFQAGKYTNLRFEPRVGRQLIHQMLTEAGAGRRLDVLLRARVTQVQHRADTVTGAIIEYVTAAGDRAMHAVTSRVLIDATEWGDVLPLAGARYRSGNRTDDALDLARTIQENTWTAVIKQHPGGVPPSLRLPSPPPGYATMRPHFAARIVPGDGAFRRGQPMSWKSFVEYRGMPDSARPAPAPGLTRTHLNFSNDYPCTVAYLEDPAQRVTVDRAMRLRTLQLLYFIQQDLGVTDWAVADDEGFNSPHNRAQIDAWLRDQPELAPYRTILYHFSILPYVRESRRLVGRHTLLAREISRGPGKRPMQFPSTIGLGDYRLDLHGGRAARDLELDLDRIEDLEDAVPGRAGPFALPLECLVPVTLDGFLAAEKNYSQTRLVNGATRMQPHTLNVGQAAGALAALAVRHAVPPRRIDPVLVQRVLLAAGSTLLITPLQDVPQEAADWPALQLVAVHGLMALADGHFHPQRPVHGNELATMVLALGGHPPAAAAPAAAVTRADLARALAAIAAPEVRLVFPPDDAAGTLPLTRSEAAQVLAEFLELRALARLHGRPEVQRWDTVRSASASVPAPAPAALSRDLRRLRAAQIITGTDYWTENAVAGRECEGARVADLLWRAAQFLETGATPASAIDVLLRSGVIASADYWRRTARADGRCAGKNVAALLRNLAAHERVQHLAAPNPVP